MGIELPIFFNKIGEDVIDLDGVEIIHNVDELDIETVYFNKIDVIQSYAFKGDQSRKYSMIKVNGDEWICSLSYRETVNRWRAQFVQYSDGNIRDLI